MKVGVISGLFEPYAVGGAEIVAKAEAMSAKDRGDDVFVITSAPRKAIGGPGPSVEEKDGLRIYRFFPLNLFHYAALFHRSMWVRAVWHVLDMFNVHSFLAIRKILKREKPDLVRTHSVKGLGYLTWAAVASTGLPCVHRLHDIQMIEPSGLLMAGREKSLDDLFHRFYRIIARFLIGSPATVVSPSRWLLNMHAERGFFPKSETRVLPNSLPEFHPSKTEKEPSDFLRLLYVGQIETHKGIAFLVETLKKDLKAPFQLRIAGDGSKMDDLVRSAAGDDRFEILGKVDQEGLRECFSRVDILIVPSICHENSPTVIGIAKACGVKALASRVGGIPEMVGEESLFPPGDSAALIRLLEKEANEKRAAG